jgi:hypothetical protein
MLRTAALVYLFIGSALMMMAEAAEKPGTCTCSCQSRSGTAPVEPTPLAPGELAELPMLDA